MAKELVTGAAVFLVGALLGAFVFTGGGNGMLGSMSAGGEVTNPVVFYDTVGLDAETTLSNCGSLSYTIPAIGRNDDIGATDASYTSTTITVTGAATGDLAFVAVPTAALGIYNIEITAQAATSAVVAIFKNMDTVATTTAIATTTILGCYLEATT